MQSEQDELLRAVHALVPELQENALGTDAAAQFPVASFQRLIALGLLTASLPGHLGGLDFGYGAAGATALLRLFETLGEADLAVARLFEAHVNALQLILRYGSRSLASGCAQDAAQGHIFALWVTDAADRPLIMEPAPCGFTLRGVKEFCSGAGVVSRALITAWDAPGTRMLLARLDRGGSVRASSIKLGGMRAAVTGGYDFSGMPVDPSDLIGEVADYLKEPVFSAGAWRGSAAALGGLKALLTLHRNAVLHRHREDDPHQQARFGQALIAYETARLWMEKAACLACVEQDTAQAIMAYVNLARIAVETACLDAMRLTQRSLGLAGFIAGSRAELICRDLATYLRQPAPDETLAKAASFYFSEGLDRLGPCETIRAN